MNSIIYHGSRNIIERPIFGYGKPYNDYGLGFYCTEDRDMAMEWAVGDGINGYASGYSLDTCGLKIIDLNNAPYTPLHWLSVLITYRTFDIDLPLAVYASDYIKTHFFVDVDSYDIVKGYRADDSYFMYARDFLSGAISYRQLTEAFRLGNLGEQFVLKSRESFNRIVPLGYDVAYADFWYPIKFSRDKKARENYRTLRLPDNLKDELFITHILEEEIKPDDSRL